VRCLNHRWLTVIYSSDTIRLAGQPYLPRDLLQGSSELEMQLIPSPVLVDIRSCKFRVPIAD
jgi:hypothetical protein